jgi:flagellar motor switch protein FliN/FliY
MTDALAEKPAGGTPPAATVEVQPVQFGEVGEGRPAAAGGTGTPLDQMLDLTVTVTAEAGRATLSLAEVLALAPGSVIELAKSIEEPLELQVNGRVVARGEVVVINDRYGIRITSLGES